MRKFFATIDYIITIIFTIIHIFFVVLTMNLSNKTHIDALATSLTYQKILLVITIIYLIIFIFIGNPMFYKSKMKKNFKIFIGFIKNVFYILNSLFIIQIFNAAVNEVTHMEGLNLWQQIKALNESLSLFGINGFYVFYMYITLILSTIRILSWVFRVLKTISRRRRLKKKLKEKQMKS